MSIADPYGALSGPLVPGILDNPFRGTVPGPAGIRIPAGLAQDLMASSALLTENAVTPNPMFGRLQPRSPLTQLPGQALRRAFTPQAPAIDRNYQEHLTTLVNKYEELSPVLAQLPAGVRDYLVAEDSRRVSQGTAPMTREQTMLAIETIQSGEQATEEPSRSPFGILGNLVSNAREFLGAIPRIPTAIANEIVELPQAGARFAEALDRGESPITAAFGSTPGLRMLPGAYVASQLGRGGEGISELAANPLFTAADILPFAHGAAARTRVGQAAAARTAAARASLRPGEAVRPFRPVTAVLTERLTPSGELVHNVFGQAIEGFLRETPIGQSIRRLGGRDTRLVARIQGIKDQRLKAILLGDIDGAANTAEVFGSRAARIFDEYSKIYPHLRKGDRSAAGQQWRSQLWNDVQRDPSRYDPGFVNAIRDLNFDIAQFHQLAGNMGMFDGEWYDRPAHQRLTASQERLVHARLMARLRGEYLSPSGRITAGDMRRWRDEIATVSSDALRARARGAWETTADAYGLVYADARGRIRFDEARFDALADNTVLTPRVHQLDDALKVLNTADRQAILAEAGIRYGKRSETTRRLNNLANRKPPDPITQIPGFVDDARSLARRYDFETRVGRRFTDEYATKRAAAHDQLHSELAPARFHGLLSDDLRARAITKLSAKAELSLGRRLTATEAAQLVAATEARVWTRVPGLDPTVAAQMVHALERDVVKTWRKLRAAGHDPVFVHKVSPTRTEQTLRAKIGVVPSQVSQIRERVLDLSPAVEDLQVSLTHAAKELIEQEYSIQVFEQVGDAVARTERQLRDQHFDEAQWRAAKFPQLNAEGHLTQIIKRSYEKFNPQAAGFSWGGTRLSKYDQGEWYVPKPIADNLKKMAPRVHIFSNITDPLTRAFRYNVIGLSPQIIVNNFLSNSVAMATELGPRPLKYWSAARKYLKAAADGDQAVLRTIADNEELLALVQAEAPFLEHLDREAWMATRVGSQVMSGVNAYHAFTTSAAAEATKRFGRNAKKVTDAVVRQSLRAQRWGDNVFRVMTFLDQVERNMKIPGFTRAQAENAAIEMTRRLFVDYASFTPVERTAMRQLVPFYSYMGHAARLVSRYPLNHPIRTAIMGAIARAEVDRLGALPGSFLSMIPIPGFDLDPTSGHQTFFSARPFDPFGDTADLLSVAGWLAAMNPAVQIALQQVGVIRGESELYPTLRYDPETGRMRAVHPGFLESAIFTTVPRFGVIGSVLGLNPAYNELRQRNPDAANRSLAAQAGIPRPWRDVDVFREMTRAELTRQNAANDVLNEAVRSGDWGEALRYPSLAAYYAQVQALNPQQVAAMTPASADDIAATLTQALGG